MKKFLMAALLGLMLCCTANAVIVNNSGTSPADSISIPFVCLDSLGNPIAMVSGDSVYLVVFYPSGAICLSDSVAYNGSPITAGTNSGNPVYSWKEPVADIDGTAENGVYSYIVTAVDVTGSRWKTPNRGQFQLYTAADYNVMLDSLGLAAKNAILALAEVLNIDAWNPITDNDSLIIDQTTLTALKPTVAGRTLDVTTGGAAGVDWANVESQGTAVDLSSTAISLVDVATAVSALVNADVIQVSGDATAANNLEAMLDGTGGVTLTTGITGNITGNLSGSVGSVTAEVDADVTAISGDATAANNFETMLDGTGGQTLSLGRMVVSGANGTNGSFYIANSTGDAAIFNGGGDGMGIDLQGAGAGSGIRSVGGATGHGIRLDGGGTSGHGLYANAPTSGDGIYAASGGGGDPIATEISAQIVDDVWDEDSTGHYTSPNMAFVASQTSASSLTLGDIADAVWDEVQSGHSTAGTFGLYLDEAISGITASVDSEQVARAVWDSDVVPEASRTVYAAGDTYTPDVNVTSLGAGVIEAADFATGAITATVIAADAIGSSEIATDAIGAAEIAASAIGASEIATDAIGAAELAANSITSSEIADDAIDFGAFAGTAPTAWWNEGKTGYALTQTFPTNFADLAITATTGLVDINGKTGFSLASSQTFNMTGNITGNLSGSVGSVTGAVGSVTSTVNADLVAITGGDAAEADSLKAGLNGYANGQLTNREHLFTYLDAAVSGISATVDSEQIARAVWDDDVVAEVNRTVTATASVDSFAIARAVWGIAGADDSTYADGTMGKEAADWDGSSTSGDNVVTIWAIDSTEVGDTLSNIDITVRNSAGTIIDQPKQTGSTGRINISLDDGTYTIIATSAGYTFPSVSRTIAGALGVDTTYIAGDAFSVANPGSPDQCNVYAYVYDGSGNIVEGALVKATLPSNERITDTCNSTIIAPRATPVETDSDGKFTISLAHTSCLLPTALKWTIEVTDPKTNEPLKSWTITVPSDSTTYYLK